MTRTCADCACTISRSSQSGCCTLCARNRARTRLRRDQPPLPAGFAAFARGKGIGPLEAYYGVGERTIKRWRNEAGIEPFDPGMNRHSRALVPVPTDFAEQAATLRTIMKLSAHYGRDRKTINRWLVRAGVELQSAVVRRSQARHPNGPQPQPKRHTAPAHHRIRLVPGKVHLPAMRNMAAPALAGREQEAAQHLRRSFPHVYRCDEKGHPDQKGKMWRCGALVLQPVELIERAEAKGFRPDAWQELAA